MQKYALVTGASGGIGYEFATLLALDGYNLVLVARNGQRLNEIKSDFESKHSIKVVVLAKDLTKEKGAEEIYHELQHRQIRIDILINNAGFGDFGLFRDTDWKKEEQMIHLNVRSLTHLTKLFLKGMLERKQGKILNVASTAAFQPGPLMAVYFATKAYVLSFSEAIANELKGTGVSVTVLCPGPTQSGFQAASKMYKSDLVKGKKLPSAEAVAKCGYWALKKGKVVAIHGISNYLSINAERLVPRNVVTSITRRLMGKGD